MNLLFSSKVAVCNEHNISVYSAYCPTLDYFAYSSVLDIQSTRYLEVEGTL